MAVHTHDNFIVRSFWETAPLSRIPMHKVGSLDPGQDKQITCKMKTSPSARHYQDRARKVSAVSG